MLFSDLSSQTLRIVKMEYFFDTDPGILAGTPLTISSAADSISFDTSISVPAGLKPGLHKLYVRTFTDSFNRWSISEGREFYIVQKLNAAEYFIDTDPGQGNGIAMSVASPADSIAATYSIAVPSTISNGFHYLYVRTRTSDGIWSITSTSTFEVYQGALVSSEYFIDTDPGVGMGTPISIGTPSDSTSNNYTISVPSNISNGIHKVYVRTKSSDGIWGLTDVQSFDVYQASLVSSEYFIDIDPGVGQGTPLSIAIPSDSTNNNYTVSVPSNMSNGIHKLYVRTKSSDGIWGLDAVQNFDVFQASLVSSEYFIDNDPGVGLGTPISIAVPADSTNITYTITVPSLIADGFHRIFVRTKTNEGVWGLAIPATFEIFQSKIVQAEYFIDSDPGIGNGVNIPISNSSDSIDNNLSIIPYCASNGQHLFYIRTLDSKGNWSMTEPDTFSVSGFITASHIVPGPGPDSTPVKLIGIQGAGSAYTYRNFTTNTPFQSNPHFAVANGASAIFMVKDTLGCISNDTVVSIAPPTQISLVGGTKKIRLDGYNNFVYFLDTAGKLLGGVNDRGTDLDTVAIASYINAGPIRYTPAFIDTFPYIDRNWKISALNTVVSTRGLMLPFLNSEYDSLNKAKGYALGGPSTIKFHKYNGANENFILSDNDTSDSYYKVIPAPNISQYGNASQYISNFDVPSFSEFFTSGNTLGFALPITLFSFNARKVNESKAIIEWVTGSEHQVSHFEIERSLDAIHFETIQRQPATNTVNTTNYSIEDDISELSGIIYYRLKSVDVDTKFTFSKIAYINKNFSNKISIFPNPASNEIRILSDESIESIQINDMLGRAVMGARQVKKLNIENLMTGNYIIEIKTSNRVEYVLLTVKR